MPLDRGVEFDHVLPDGLGGEPTLENCLCVCKRCHDYKTHKGDIPRIAKMKRQRDRHLSIAKPKWKWPKRKMNARYASNVKQIDEALT